MRKRSLWSASLFALLILVPAVFLANLALGQQSVARGKAAALPLADAPDAQQQRAQDLALADTRVQALTTGHRSEVFGVQPVWGQYTEAARSCATSDCRQVNIYNFDESATVAVIVDLDAGQVLDVLHQPGTRPGINRRLADRAMELALNAPEVIAVIGHQPTNSDWAPMDSTLVGSACEEGHMCVAPTFDLGDYILWAIVDLTDDRFLDLYWTATDGVEETDRANPYPYEAPEGGCPPAGNVTREGWVVNYNTTGTDGFRVFDVTFNGVPIITSAKLPEWHADYGSSGYQDSTGCGGGGGGFPIYPYGNTQTRDLIVNGNVVGFEVEQDFRMSNWGAGCNYRYDQHFQFFTDGRYRVVAGAYGKGCGTNSLYRPIIRIDLAAGGTSGGDSLEAWSGSGWAPQATEIRYSPNSPLSPEGYGWRLKDSNGQGVYIQPGRGQFGDGGRGDNEFLYAVQHRASEGDTDLGVFSVGCCNDTNHGPELYVNNESIQNQDIVLWYVPQALTQVTVGSYYCWTVQGEPNPQTYPCFTGPMFIPTTPTVQPPEATVTIGNGSNEPYAVGEPVPFTGNATGGGTMTYAWTFGDGGTSTEQNPTHTYAAPGTYTVTLTVTNEAGSDSASGTVTILQAPDAAFTIGDGSGNPVPAGQPVAFTNNSTGGGTMTYAWNFGDGGTSTETNPTHAYAAAGTYTVTLTVTNEVGSDSFTRTITVTAPTAVTLSEFNTGRSELPLLTLWGVGSLLAMGIAVGRIHAMRRRS